MKIKKKIIQVPRQSVIKMAQAYGIHEGAVYRYLRFEGNSLRAEKVRKDALEVYGGVVTTKLIMH